MYYIYVIFSQPAYSVYLFLLIMFINKIQIIWVKKRTVYIDIVGIYVYRYYLAIFYPYSWLILYYILVVAIKAGYMVYILVI